MPTVTTYNTTALRVFFFGLMLVGRGLWEGRPTFWLCLMFWLFSLTWDALQVAAASSTRSRLFWFAANAGGYLNAAVTLANNGHMPVVGVVSGQDSLWVIANESHRLLPLCDRFAGFSLGDLLMASGALLCVVWWAVTKIVTRGQLIQAEHASG